VLADPPRRPRGEHSHRRARRSVIGRVSVFAWWTVVMLLLVAGTAAALTHFIDVPVDVPARTPSFGAGVVTTVLCGVLAHRLGAHTLAATVFAAGATAVALVAEVPWLLAGVAALTAFAATVLGVVVTKPAKRPLSVVTEYAIAIVVALVGAVAVAAYTAPVSPATLNHVVLLTSLVATLWVAHRLGGGFTGLGSRGALVIVSAVVVLVIGLAYGEALEQWGSRGLTSAVATARQAAADVLGAVPRPLELFIGFPALVWGLATRAKLRQGWWVCAFGALGTAGIATSLASPGAQLSQELLSTLYSALLGLALGCVVCWVDRLLTGPRGRRAMVVARALPLRPEPSRLRPLL
jgi:hypothetical protein